MDRRTPSCQGSICHEGMRLLPSPHFSPAFPAPPIGSRFLLSLLYAFAEAEGPGTGRPHGGRALVALALTCKGTTSLASEATWPEGWEVGTPNSKPMQAESLLTPFSGIYLVIDFALQKQNLSYLWKSKGRT